MNLTLLQRLRQCVSDELDIEPILINASGGGVRTLSRGRVEFQLADSTKTVFATVFIKQGRITDIKPGPALESQSAQDSLVETARKEAAQDHGSFSANRVLLSERKLAGYYQWKDRLRIAPCPTSAPIGAGLNSFRQTNFVEYGEGPDGPPYPFMLRVYVSDSPNPLLRSRRVLRELDTYQNLLALLVSGHIRTFDRLNGRVWTLISREHAIENHLLHPGFTTGDEIADTSVAAPIYQGDDYYNHLWVRDSEILIPPSIEQDLETFQSLDPAAAQKLKRATYWYALGIKNRNESSLSTVAFSTAIECLLPRLSRPRCSLCNSELGRGPTHLFKAHLSRYGTVPESLYKQRSELYVVRSALVHGSYASTIDTAAFSALDDTDVQDMLLELVTRRSLLNWLRDPARMTWCDR